jgi:cytochrome b561
MTDASLPAVYDKTSARLHWGIAALIAANALIPFYAETLPREGRPSVMNYHAIIGALVLILTLWRIVNRTRRPAPPLIQPRWSVISAKVGHGFLYLATLLLPISGAVAWAFRGRGFDFGLFQIPSPVAADRAIGGPAGDAHGVIFWLGAALVAGHVAAALYHQFVMRDGLISRMRPR